jgi:predicted nucleic acid-binding protein
MIRIVDASAAIKWFIREEFHENALQLLDPAATLCAPDLLVTEAASIAWKKAVLGEISRNQAESITACMQDYIPELYPSVSLIRRALQIALSLNHPIYDCLYLACTEVADGTMVTADRRLCRKVQGTDFENRVCHLADIPLSRDQK